MGFHEFRDAHDCLGGLMLQQSGPPGAPLLAALHMVAQGGRHNPGKDGEGNCFSPPPAEAPVGRRVIAGVVR